MFTGKTALGNARRYWRKTLLHILVCTAAVLFLQVYMGNLEKSREQIQELSRKVPIEVSVTSLDGSRESGIFIKDFFYQAVKDSPYVEDPEFTMQLAGETEGRETAVMAVSTWKAVTGAEEENFSLEEELDSFFGSTEGKCIVEKEFLANSGLEVGDTVSLRLWCYRLEGLTDIYTEPLGEKSWKIAGILEAGEKGGQENALFPEILLPLDEVRQWMKEQQAEVFLDSGRFSLKDGQELNAFKAEMEEAGFLEVVPKAETSYAGNALVVRDETYIRASGSMVQGYGVMKAFLPVAFFVLALTGFVTAYLLCGSRRKEYAVYRALGVSKKQCMAFYLLEYGLAEAAGGALGTWIAAAASMLRGLWPVVDFAGYFLCFLAGTAVALTAMGRMSVAEVLAKAE